MHALLDASATDAPQASAVRDDGGVWTYAELLGRSQAAEGWLSRHGVGRGDRVVVQVSTTRHLVALFFGTVRRGAIFVPINPEMKAFQLRSVLANAEPRVVVCTRRALEEVRSLTPVPVVAADDAWAAMEADVGAASPIDVQPDDIAALMYTSGSTSAPKAVIIPHAQMTFAASAIHSVLQYRPDDVVFCRFSMSWDYGLYNVLLTCLGRSTVVLAGDRSDLSLLEAIRQTGTTIVPLVPSLATMLLTLARRETARISTVRLFTNTGAALPEATIDALREWFPGAKVVRQFGQTECKRVSIMPLDEELERPGSVGLPLPGTKVLILDPAGEPVPPGDVGEIVVVGPHVMPGYWRMPEVSREVFRRDEAGRLRLHTGDFGRLDDDGYLYFEGRRDDMFKRKGVRMSTLEIEAAATDISGVHSAAALPPEGGHDLTIFVVGDVPPHQVLRELSRRLEPAKVPAACRRVDALPLTTNGKYSRPSLSSLLEERV